MERSDKIIVWSILGVVSILTASIGSCTCVINYQDDSTMSRMVKDGADVVGARCAIKGTQNDVICAILAAKR